MTFARDDINAKPRLSSWIYAQAEIRRLTKRIAEAKAQLSALEQERQSAAEFLQYAGYTLIDGEWVKGDDDG